MTSYYLAAAFLSFLFLAVIWTTKDRFNFGLKLYWIWLTCVGGFELVKHMGYLVKLP